MPLEAAGPCYAVSPGDERLRLRYMISAMLPIERPLGERQMLRRAVRLIQ